MIRAAIFDADGTLFDSMSVCNNLGNEYLKRYGIFAGEDLKRKLFSMTVPQALGYIIAKYGLTVTQAQAMFEIDILLADYYENRVILKAGAKDMLDSLRGAGIPMIIATSTAKMHIIQALKRWNILDYFIDVLSCEQLNTDKSKPYIFETALQRLGEVAEETYLFEDALYSIITAKKLGIRIVGIYDNEGDSDRRTLKENCDIFFDSFEDFDLSLF